MTDATPALLPELIQEFVASAHGSLPRVQVLLAGHPALLHATHWWDENNPETAIEAAAHVGSRPIAEFLLAQGATMSICTAAMLGDVDRVRVYLAEDAALANARGAHGITVMFHAALSGSTAIAQLLKNAGCAEGYNHALHAAASKGHAAMTAWLLTNGADDVNAPNYAGKMPLAVALEQGYEDVAALLRAHGGKEERPA